MFEKKLEVGLNATKRCTTQFYYLLFTDQVQRLSEELLQQRKWMEGQGTVLR